MTETSVVAIDRLELAFDPRPWPFADQRRAEIDAYFAKLQQTREQLWNGRALLVHRFNISNGVFYGRCFETDYASFLAWRDWDAPDRSVHNCSAMGAIRCADGAFLLGVMAPYTASAGRIYFPAGVPEPSDIVEGFVDLEAGVRRELREETGLREPDVIAQPGWCTVLAGPRISPVKTFMSKQNGAAQREQVLRHLASEEKPELSDIRIVRGPADVQPSMLPTAAVYMQHMWAMPS